MISGSDNKPEPELTLGMTAGAVICARSASATGCGLPEARSASRQNARESMMECVKDQCERVGWGGNTKEETKERKHESMETQD